MRSTTGTSPGPCSRRSGSNSSRRPGEPSERQVQDGQPAAEVAEELGISVNAVLIAKSRVLKRLREKAAGLVDVY